MHNSSMLRMQWFKDSFIVKLETDKVSVLDVGSQCVPEQVNIATYKTLFTDQRYAYTGLDMTNGFNVDVVVRQPYDWAEISSDSFDVVISGQVLEHVEFPWLTMSEIARVLKPEGLVCIIVPSMQQLHRHPVNCQNYFADGLIALSKYTGLDIIHASTNCAPLGAGLEWYSESEQDTILIARKPQDWNKSSLNLENYILVPSDLTKVATGLITLENQPYYPIISDGTYDVEEKNIFMNTDSNVHDASIPFQINPFETIFVTDSNKYLSGIITMGDFFRKALLSKSITELMNTNYMRVDISDFGKIEYLQIRDAVDKIFNENPNIRKIPVLNNGYLLFVIKKKQ